MNEADLLIAILGRAEVLLQSCNSHQINHQEGVLRGLVWAYIGKDPGVLRDPAHLGTVLGKKITDVDGKLAIEETGAAKP